ncbi:hypothetical protein GCM10007895_22210 [Paraferrimonas sedimenticola]|uniref:Peptidase S8/S53 domain-containing protein n=2 Tax=Paraferrimonas sedimenticola TaxID=375674 RepID=A0AA37RX45_9GAMM|nr:hypothetical protein GCM10007895_22210 [Paraferrimonas sedimenticola]
MLQQYLDCPEGVCPQQQLLIKQARAHSQVAGVQTENSNTAAQSYGTLALKPYRQSSVTQLQSTSLSAGDGAEPHWSQAWSRLELSSNPIERQAQLQALAELRRQQPDLVVEAPQPRYLTGFQNQTEIPHTEPGWQWSAIDLLGARDWLASKSNGTRPIVVAVIDSGIDYTHPDLQPFMWRNPAEIEGDGIDNDGNGIIDDIHGASFGGSEHHGEPMDTDGHGTHVAGILAQMLAELKDTGIADIRIMAIKATSDKLLYSNDIAEAVDYAVSMGVDVINMSFGGSVPSQLEQDAISSAFKRSLLVASAGNSGKPNSSDCQTQATTRFYPAAYPYVVGVMASQPQLDEASPAMAAFSNWDCVPGDELEYEIMAPGLGIYSTLPNNQYASWNGTSMASPIVAATLAVMNQDNPGESHRELTLRLLEGSPMTYAHTLSDGEVQLSYPKLDLLKALQQAPVPLLSLSQLLVYPSTDNLPGSAAANPKVSQLSPGQSYDLALELHNYKQAGIELSVQMLATDANGNTSEYVKFSRDTQQWPAAEPSALLSNGLLLDASEQVIGAEQPFRFEVAEGVEGTHTVKLIADVVFEYRFDPQPRGQYRARVERSMTLVGETPETGGSSGGSWGFGALIGLLIAAWRRKLA